MTNPDESGKSASGPEPSAVIAPAITSPGFARGVRFVSFLAALGLPFAVGCQTIGGDGSEIIDASEAGPAAGLTRDEIESVIKANVDQLKTCRETSTPKGAEFPKGRVKVRFVIEADGRVGSIATVDNTTSNAALAACTEERLRTWKFPPPHGGGKVEVGYPFVFLQETKADPVPLRE